MPRQKCNKASSVPVDVALSEEQKSDSVLVWAYLFIQFVYYFHVRQIEDCSCNVCHDLSDN